MSPAPASGSSAVRRNKTPHGPPWCLMRLTLACAITDFLLGARGVVRFAYAHIHHQLPVFHTVSGLAGSWLFVRQKSAALFW